MKTLIILSFSLFAIAATSVHASMNFPVPANPQILDTYGDAYLEVINTLPVLHLNGNYSEMGIQYGNLMGIKVGQVFSLLDQIADKEAKLKIPKWLASQVESLIGFVFWQWLNADSRDFIRGMVKGARMRGVKIGKYQVAFLNAIIDLGGIFKGSIANPAEAESRKALLDKFGLGWLPASNCDSMAVWGSRTVDGKTFQTRNTDIDTSMGLEEYPLVTVFKPTGLVPYVTAGFVGQFGVFTGMNANGVALGQIWAFSNSVAIGNPWQLEIMTVMSHAADANDAVNIFQKLGARTYGSNFIFADANGNGHAVEATPKDFAVYHDNDPAEDLAVWNGQKYDIRLTEAVFRGDCALNPKIRSYQTADNGPSGDPRTSSAYQERYEGQATLIQSYQAAGTLIGEPEAENISKSTAMVESSLQAAVYANTDRQIWISYAVDNPDGTVTGAYAGTYHNIPFSDFTPQLKIVGEQLKIDEWIPSLQTRHYQLQVQTKEGYLISTVSVATTELHSVIGSARDLGFTSGNVLVLVQENGNIADRLVVR